MYKTSDSQDLNKKGSIIIFHLSQTLGQGWRTYLLSWAALSVTA